MLLKSILQVIEFMASEYDENFIYDNDAFIKVNNYDDNEIYCPGIHYYKAWHSIA